jgi:hypothetical protein
MTYPARHGVQAIASQRNHPEPRQRERNSSLEGINPVVRAFKEEMQKIFVASRLPATGCIRPEINPPETREGSGALAEPN